MSNILVTGGAGFIGSTLCERLLMLGHNVINLDNFNDFYDPLTKRGNIASALLCTNYKLIEGDINDTNLLYDIFENYNINTVVHLAAMAGVRQSIADPIKYVDVDIRGTVNILECSNKFKVNKLIFASSSSVYGKNIPPFKESDPIEIQVSPYAAAKRSGELFCSTYNELYGIPVICLRFFTVYGPRQRPEMAIYRFVRLIDEECEVNVFGDGSSSRDYTYVDDIIDGIITSIDYNCGFEIFNLGNSSIVHLNDLIELIELKLGKKSILNYMPSQPGDVEFTCADIKKSEILLGYSPKIKIDEGVERFVKWYHGDVAARGSVLH
jgi:UDP-glucuronate 4-epimerase